MAYQPKSYRKFIAGSVTTALVASALAAPVGAAAAASFPDVPKSHWAHAEITALVEQGIINGYQDGSFKPNQLLNRGQAAALFTNALGLEIPENLNVFKDLKSTSYFAQYAAAVEKAGIFGGYTNGNFGAGDELTREQMATALVKAFGLKDNGKTVNLVDLDKVYVSHRENVKILAQHGITTGNEKGEFSPKAKVSRAHFATFLHRALVQAGKLAENPAVEGVKAINNTTVEVSFKEAVKVEDLGTFTIEGKDAKALEVKNAVLKQTDSKTVVLTTAAQTADEVYTVKLGSDKLGTFKGISAVVPTAIKVTTPSLQGTIGKEVTVKAEVTVPDGQSKAGIPVTFNIVNDNSNLNNKIEVVAYTNDKGEASYTYTRYYKNNDNVTAYATEKSSVYASGKVYWAEGLTITEVTTGNELANGAKKVYKVKTDSYATQYLADGKTVDYNYVNVAFAENLDVAPDKLVRDVEVIDTGVSTNAKYPSQVTTGGINEVRVKVDAKGEATFTLTGSSASVTPIVFVDTYTNSANRGKHEATELKAAAPTVKFALSHTLGLAVKAEGVQNAAAINNGNANNKGTGEGGREYTVTVTDKDGKVAPAGTIAYVTFEQGNYSTDKKAYILDANNARVEIKKGTVQAIKVTGTKGEAKFTLVGERDAYAAPTVYLETGKEAGLDKADLQTVAESTYFVDAVINNADLKIKNAAGKEVTTLPTTQSAFFHYNSVDQNGFDYYAGTGSYEVSYEVTAHFADVTVNGTFGSKLVKKGTTETVKVNASAGKAVLEVKSENVASNVTVNASASQVSLPNKSASIAFTKGTELPAVYTGPVTSIDVTKNQLTFAGYDAITYSTSSFKNEQGVVINESKFEELVSDALVAKKKVEVTAVKNADGTYTLEIESISGAPVAGTGTITTAILSADGKKLTLTFDKNLNTSSIDLADFSITTGTVNSVASATGNTVVLNVNGTTTDVDTTDTVGVAADKVIFTDGTSNAVISTIAITQPGASKISTLTELTKNQTAVTQVDAKGSVTVGTKTVNLVVATTETNQAEYNGVKVVVKQNGALAATDPTASYDTITKTITVELYTNPATVNDLTTINAAIQGLTPDHGGIDFSEISLTGDALTFADVATPVTITLAGGVDGVSPAQAGVYTFTINSNLVVGDKITLNGKVYVAGTDFVVGSTPLATATNLAAKIQATDARFATAAASGTGLITLTDKVINDAAAPTLSWN
ncbi:S-layer homology domain-containing protein [Cytobacillus massiliigabonensis]|uniref:S-layer homology domain-containing protein n=1 Tax=Cytobacillus massiliigabonensis TaxID=1871011 RepID=UPI0015E155F7|nr:S-layer homology domain-containing protein [Cytobacillus massiliigabonensis]